jgi:hypothetical protein
MQVYVHIYFCNNKHNFYFIAHKINLMFIFIASERPSAADLTKAAPRRKA